MAARFAATGAAGKCRVATWACLPRTGARDLFLPLGALGDSPQVIVDGGGKLIVMRNGVSGCEMDDDLGRQWRRFAWRHTSPAFMGSVVNCRPAMGEASLSCRRVAAIAVREARADAKPPERLPESPEPTPLHRCPIERAAYRSLDIDPPHYFRLICMRVDPGCRNASDRLLAPIAASLQQLDISQ